MSSGLAPGIPNLVQSAHVSNFARTANTYADVTNSSISITTRGNPVMIVFSQGYIQLDGDGAGGVDSIQGYVKILRDASTVAEEVYYQIAKPSTHDLSLRIPSGGICMFETPAAGTYTYKIQTKVISSPGVGTITVSGYLTVLELEGTPGN